MKIFLRNVKSFTDFFRNPTTMKELYKLMISHGIFDNLIINIKYIRTIHNNIYYHQDISEIGISFRKDCDYRTFNRMRLVRLDSLDRHLLMYTIIHDHYDDFKILVEYYMNRCAVMTLYSIFLCTSIAHHRFGIYLLKRLQSPLLLYKFLEPCCYNIEKWHYKIFKYIISDSYYSHLTLTCHKREICDIYKLGCDNNQYKLIKLLLLLKTSDADKITVNMIDIKTAGDRGYKNLVIVLYDAWFQQVEDEKIIAKKIRDKYLY